jgi:hypothetical protein
MTWYTSSSLTESELDKFNWNNYADYNTVYETTETIGDP